MALLTYLAVERPRAPHRRDVLTHLLWPERDDVTARRNLRQSLYRLRQSLGEGLIAGLGEQSIALAPDALWCDAVAFEAALEEGRPAEAMELYGGPFLKGFHVPDAREFERWADHHRDRLARRAEQASWTLAEEADEEGRVREAERWARRAIAINPFEERGWRRLMTLLDRHGERAGAVRTYQELARRLDDELGIEPSPETQAAAKEIRSRRAGPEAATPPAEKTPSPSEDRAPEEPTPSEGGAPDEPIGEPVAADGEARGRPRPSGDDRPRLRAVVLGLAAAGLLALGLLWRSGGAGDSPAPPADAPAPENTIAVLPFVDLSPDGDREYFSDGLTEELTAALAQVDDLRVVARTSAFAFRGEERDVREIGSVLGTTSLVEGSVRIEGNRLRVAARLVDADDGVRIWSETYDRELTDVFEIQEDVALRIAEALRARLTPDDRRHLSRRPTTSLEAYNDYLRGRYFWNRRSGGGLDQAVHYFERAIEADSSFARAHAGLASVFGPAGELGYLPPDPARERMRDAVRRALELHDGLAEAHTARGAYLHLYEWDGDAAERAYRRAIELDPDYGTARLWYGYLLNALGRPEEAIELGRQAVERDPLAPIMSGGLAGSHRLAGDYEAAIEHYSHALELDPDFWLVHENLGKLHATRGDLEAAVRSFRRAAERAGPTPRARAGLARVLALSGDTAEAWEIVERLRARGAEEELYFPEVATALEALGATDEAYEWLERSYEQRNPRLQHLGVDPSFDRLRDDPRFHDLLRRIGVAD